MIPEDVWLNVTHKKMFTGQDEIRKDIGLWKVTEK